MAHVSMFLGRKKVVGGRWPGEEDNEKPVTGDRNEETETGD